jgi:hypothetical protein
MRTFACRTRTKGAFILSMCVIGTLIWCAVMGRSTAFGEMCTAMYWDDCERPCTEGDYQCVPMSCACEPPTCGNWVSYRAQSGSCGKIYRYTRTVDGSPWCETYVCNSSGNFCSSACTSWFKS